MADNTDINHVVNKLQFHYWLSDRTHTMDALVLNKCERELLEITRAVAKLCQVNLMLETEPSGKGGLKSWLTLAPKTPRKTSPSRVALVKVMVAAGIATSPKASASTVLNRLLDSLATEAGLSDEQLHQWQNNRQQLKEEAARLIPVMDQHPVIRKRRSNLFKLLSKYPKVKGFSVSLTNKSHKPVTEDLLIVHDQFAQQIISTPAVPTEVVEQAQLEIISPVLVKGPHKWKGMYQQQPISFTMKSDEFMELVQTGKVEFKSGSTITCNLAIDKKMTAAGEVRISGYNILSVSRYSENGKTLVVAEERPKPKQPVVSKRQLDLFG
ncbi:MAG: hypothetical protein MUE95_08050 [Cyclobacteriaceae bacterium]|jgi:hypothetical protein|nr:hypothetical protein [Cyclobacteriaceae bacterium]